MTTEHIREPDAWQQHRDLLARFTKEFPVRNSLTVTALATDRRVQLKVTPTTHYHNEPTPRPVVSTHNVSTMRELAEAILAACAFVDDSNPEWASSTTSDNL